MSRRRKRASLPPRLPATAPVVRPAAPSDDALFAPLVGVPLRCVNRLACMVGADSPEFPTIGAMYEARPAREIGSVAVPPTSGFYELFPAGGSEPLRGVVSRVSLSRCFEVIEVEGRNA